MKLRLLVLFLLPLSPLSLRAQLGLYGGFTVQNVGTPWANGNVFYGGTLGAYLAGKRLSIVNVGGDLRGSFSRDSGDTLNTGAIGPRIGFNLHVIPLHPYAEATVGLANLHFRGGSNNDTRFEYQILGGLDITVLPRIDWRIVEYSYGGFSVPNGDDFHPKTFTTGIVLRLPRVFPMP
ncbi:MAG TPA: hypothetical protein VGM27_10580 [Acidobacteriaceae bacterium]